LVNRNARGWVVTLINNRGVYKPQQGLAQVNRAEVAEVSIELTGSEVQSLNEWTEGLQLKKAREGNASRVSIEVPPGGVRIVELVVR
jgi:hypothetical protein